MSLRKQPIITLSVALCIAAGPATAGLLPDRVERAAQERIDTGTNQTLVIAVQDGDKTEIKTFGKLDNGKAPDGDTIYEIGSITKTFTATILAREVLAGKMTLDTPIAKLLPDFKIPSRSGKDITLGEIAEQHSGLPRMPTNFHPRNPNNPYADYDAAKLRAFLAGYDLPRDPGASYEYSNLAFGLLGYALAQAEHKPYASLVDEEILRPLGMRMTGVTFTKQMRAHLAAGHDENGNAVQNWDLTSLAGAGALRSNAHDLLRYLRANMGLDRTALAEAMTLAQEPRRDVDRQKIGLAWMTAAKGFFWHNGGTGGYRTFIGFTTDKRLGVIVLTNTAYDADDLGFATLAPTAQIREVRKAIMLSGAALDEYVGSYKAADKFQIAITHVKDQLLAQVDDHGTLRIYPSAENEFFYKALPGVSITFTRGPMNEVTGLVLHENGDHAASKVSASAAQPAR